jgi:hypothetical protein
MRLIVGDLELNCALVDMFDLGYYGKLEVKRLWSCLRRYGICRVYVGVVKM